MSLREYTHNKAPLSDKLLSCYNYWPGMMIVFNTHIIVSRFDKSGLLFSSTDKL